ncbi:hypothetical protein D3C77_231700 [compost metagenome]
MLQQLSGNVERQILGIDHPFDKSEVIRQQVAAFFHDQHAIGIQLQSFLILLRVVIKRSVLRNEQDRIVYDCAVRANMDMLKRLVEAIALLVVEVLVVLLGQLVFIFSPNRHHAVDRLLFLIFLELVLRAFLRALSAHVHLNWITDEIGVLFDDRS